MREQSRRDRRLRRREDQVLNGLIGVPVGVLPLLRTGVLRGSVLRRRLVLGLRCWQGRRARGEDEPGGEGQVDSNDDVGEGLGDEERDTEREIGVRLCLGG